MLTHILQRGRRECNSSSFTRELCTPALFLSCISRCLHFNYNFYVWSLLIRRVILECISCGKGRREGSNICRVYIYILFEGIDVISDRGYISGRVKWCAVLHSHVACFFSFAGFCLILTLPHSYPLPLTHILLSWPLPPSPNSSPSPTLPGADSCCTGLAGPLGRGRSLWNPP